MSDSDEDFASADEGEVTVNPSKEGPKPQRPDDIKSIAKTQPDKTSASASASSDKQPQARTSNVKTKPAEAAKGKKKGKKQDKKSPKDKPAETKPPHRKEVSKSDNKTSAQPEKKTPSEKTRAATGDLKDVNKSENTNTETPSQLENVDKSSKGEAGDSVEQTSVVTQKPENTETEKSEDKKLDEVKEVENASRDSNTPVNSETSDSTVTDMKTDPATLIKSPSSQSIARPKPDHTDEQETVLSKLADAATEKKSGWGWGWGSSLLDVASSSVTTFTNQVGEGFNTMLETVESTLNVPDPEEMAKTNTESKQETEKPEQESEESSKDKKQETSPELVGSKSSETEAGNQPKDDDSESWFSAWGVSNITKMVENTSKTIVTGGLDVLETIGKKTFDVINEHDPGLKKTLGVVKDRGDKPNLSATLRDAKSQHEERVLQEQESEEARKSHFGALFDEFQGLAHLEALEMLSNQSEKQVNTLLGAFSPAQIGAVKPQLLQIKQHFEIDEEDDEEEVTEQDFPGLVTEQLAEINVPMSPDKLVKVQEKISACLDTENSETLPQTKVIHQQAIQSLAEFTSKAIEHFHKLGELVLLKKAELSDFTSTSKHLHSLTRVLCSEVSIMSSKFTDTLNKREESEGPLAINQLVTNVYLEASNSSSYIQDGFQLLLPVLQQATMEHCNIED